MRILKGPPFALLVHVFIVVSHVVCDVLLVFFFFFAGTVHCWVTTISHHATYSTGHIQLTHIFALYFEHCSSILCRLFFTYLSAVQTEALFQTKALSLCWVIFKHISPIPVRLSLSVEFQDVILFTQSIQTLSHAV